MGVPVNEDKLHVDVVLKDMIASAKRLDFVMRNLCKEDRISDATCAQGDTIIYLTIQEINERKKKCAKSPDNYIENMEKYLMDHAKEGVKIPVDRIENLLMDLKSTNIRMNDKIVYRINDMPLPSSKDIQQLNESIVNRLCTLDCTLDQTDANKIATRIQLISQQADHVIIQAGRSLFPAQFDVEWKTGSIITRVIVQVGLHKNRWGLRLKMEHEAILKCRIDTAIGPAIRATYVYAFHPLALDSDNGFIATEHYVAFTDVPAPRMPLSAAIRLQQPVHDRSDLAEVICLREFESAVSMSFDYPFIRTRILQCASSSVHTLFLSDIGSVFAIGSSQDGALGLGSTLESKSAQLVEFPEELTMIKQIDAGGDLNGSHSIALTSEGHVYTWGARLACGTAGHPQCSQPQRVLGALESVKCIQVAAGCQFSFALVESGHVYSWGRFLNGRLGVGPPPKRHANSRGIRNDQMVQPSPGRVQEIAHASKIACGVAHACCITYHGQLWTWGKNSSGQLGEGHLVDRYSPNVVVFPQEANVQIQSVACGRDFTLALDHNGVVWSWGAGLSVMLPPNINQTNDLPAWEWLRPRRVTSLGTRVRSISAGINHAGVITTTGDCFLWGKLGLTTIPHLVLPSRVAEAVECSNESTWVITTETFLGRDLHEMWKRKQCCNLVIIASGKRIQAHQMIVSYRCSILRDMIAAERRDSNEVVEIILPSLRYDVCLLLIEYIYTDVIYSPIIDPSSCLPTDLLRVAQEFELPGLASLCARYLSPKEIPPIPETCLLESQIHSALGSSLYADVTLLVQGEAILAHKCILIARSDYFRAMFSTSMREASLTTMPVDISYETMQRVLNFMYSDQWTCPESDEDLIDDLIAADKYGITRLKVLCEEHAVLTLENCMELLVLADMIHANLLHEKAITFILNELHVLAEAPSFIQLAQQYPKLMHEIIHHPSRNNERMLWRTWEMQEKKKQITEPDAKFPLIPFVFLIAFGISFLQVSSQFPQIGSFVPAINICGFIALCTYCYINLITL